MADQASVNGGGNAHGSGLLPLEGMVENLATFSSNIATLAELQGKLAVNELRFCARRAAWPAGVIAGSGVLMLASLPVALFGVAEWVGSTWNLSRATSLLLTGGVSLGVGALLVVICLPRLRRSFDSFEYSREELTRNIAWIKTVLAYSGRGSSKRMH
jgi:Putative Actinobacterial Holin-X, holin superfamily III